MENSERVSPKINDSYWFEFSKKLMDESIKLRDTAAGKLQTLVIWLWGIYTAYAAIGFGLTDKKVDILYVILIAAASAFLIAVYWGTIWIQMPAWTEGFDPRSPTEIADLHGDIIKIKDRRTKITLFLSIVAAISVSIALITASFSKGEVSVSEVKISPGFSTKISADNDRFFLALNANIGDTSEVLVLITPISEKSDSIKNFRFIYKPTENGLIQTSIPLENKFEKLNIKLKWINANGMRTELSKNVKYVKEPDKAG